ncbi:MAG: hypothetical protein KDA54_06330 [Phycisphaerales bacterium]|nr:hypothetical protein [Phycisphaerales bacterium]
MEFAFFLEGVAAPVATLVVLILIGNRFWRLKDERQADPLLALACGIALTVAFFAMFPKTAVPPKEHWQWILVVIWSATAAALIMPLISRITILRMVMWIATSLALAWLVFPTWEIFADKRNWWIGGIAIAIFANLESTSHLSRKRHGLSPLFMVTIGTILTSIVVVLANQAKFAQICGSIASVLGFLFLVCLLLDKREPIRGSMAFPSILIPVLAFLAYFFNPDSDGKSFPTAYVLTSITPLMVAIATLCPMGKLKGWKRFAVVQVLSIIPVAIAVVMLLMTASTEDPYSY